MEFGIRDGEAAGIEGKGGIMSLQSGIGNKCMAYRHPTGLAFRLIVLFIFIFGSPAKARPSWETEWDKTVEAAKKEGQVNVFAGPAAALMIIQAGVF